ncbi:Kef-type K+ transport system membrane component KefB [Kitasatospora sp. MAP12-15]|uniref:cation:proton antiporter n=1 Tax=unclassified Kitasatospora TaxID=2633591 RepID=UPI00247540B5|nr:cation:proton antiporter [Kitasatospora sp. MAP12-44]MDH6108770.1 Kef-type K+ transport system membrane component KefB [Kitasatospora sp. MAP12-44]
MNTEHLAAEAILATGAITALSALAAPLCRRLGQPLVVGQLVMGVALGLLPGRLTRLLFPPDVLPFLTVIAQLGLVLFLFSVGYELDLHTLHRRGRTVLLVSAGSLGVPLLLGGALGWALSDAKLLGSAAGVRPGPAILFVAVALSITAVPVLAGIIRERALTASTPGVTAMASAGITDAIGWLLLAAAVAAATTGHQSGSVPLAFAGYLLALVLVVRPALRRWMRRARPAGRDLAPVVIAVLMLSARCTSQLGLHAVFGALAIGVLMPRDPDGSPDPQLRHSVERAGSALLPLFFVVTGLTVRIGQLSGRDWLILGVVVVLATAGKLAGGAVAARIGGLGRRESLIVGTLLNTRGLTELIALNTGWSAGLIGRHLYTVLVLMALITTMLTGPLLSLLGIPVPRSGPGSEPGSEPGAAGRPAVPRALRAAERRARA